MSDDQRITNLLRKWLTGEANRTDEAQLDKAAQEDTFLADALEGYRQHPKGDHEARLQDLQQRLRHKTRRDRALMGRFDWRMVAGVALVIGLFGIFYEINRPFSSPDLAQESPSKKERTTDLEQESSGETTAPLAREEVEPVRTLDQHTEKAEKQSGANEQPPSAKEIIENNRVEEVFETEDRPQQGTIRSEESSVARAVEKKSIPTNAPQQVQPLPPRQEELVAQRGTIVDDSGTPLSGIQVKDAATGRVLTETNEQGEFRSDSRSRLFLIDTPQYQSVRWSANRDEGGYVMLQPRVSSDAPTLRPAGYSESVGSAYPSVGYDSLRTWLSERFSPPSPSIQLSFRVEASGELSAPRFNGPNDGSLGQELFELLQKGPVWVVPFGQDSVRVNFVY